MKTPRLLILFAFASAAMAAFGQEQTKPTSQPPPEATPRPQERRSGATPPGVRALRDLAYVESGHDRQKLDLYLPEQKPEQPLPLIVWIHGGAWWAGSKDGCPAVRYAQRGYAVASLGYRLSQHAVYPAQIQDCKAAIRWLRAHAKEYDINPDKIGVWGASAGGHLVALLGTAGDVKEFDAGANLEQSSRVQAVCDYYGPTDFMQIAAQAIPGARLDHNAPDSPESKLIGAPVLENKDKAARANPITFITKDDAPFLIVHGDKDPTVAWGQSQLLFDALKKTGVSVHFHTIKGAGHGGPGFNGGNIDQLVGGFFDKRLKSGAAEVEAKLSDSAAAEAPAGGRNRVPWEAILRRQDKDNDGKITKEEFTGPEQHFQRIDQNKDGVITKEEHEEELKRIQRVD